jgi:ABC-type Zn uptake system ZnuABC Zn-binding protein ZnuA
VTIAPLYCLAANVAGEDAAVMCLLKATGPHDYQPTSQDLIKVRDADLFFTIGLDLDEHISEPMAENSGNKNLKVVELGLGLDNRIRSGHQGHDHDGDGGTCSVCGHHHGEYDPHVWLGIPECIRMTELIRDQLCAFDPANAVGYKQRAADYVQRLERLRDEGRELLKSIPVEKRKLIVFHDALAYFARTFDIEVAGSIGIRPGVPPDGPRLSRLVRLCETREVRVVAMEPQYPRDAAERLIEEVTKRGVEGMKLILFDPLETATASDFSAEHDHGRDFYERRMRENLRRLAEAWQ